MDGVVELHACIGDEYRLIERIGEGGMAHVWRAQDRRGRPVAVKVLKRRRLEDAVQRERFLREAELAARVRHPNVVGIVAVGAERGHPWVAMELVEGVPFDDWLNNTQPSLDDVLDVIQQTLAGLRAVHDAGIIHRDVKPSNVLVSTNGRTCAKLIDFGISTCADREHEGMTGRGMVVGSIPWMAPERLHGEPATQQSDLYPVGLMLRQAVTGSKPFAGLSLRDLTEAITLGLLTPLETSAPWLPESLAAEIDCACAVDPRQRHESAEAFRASLLGLQHRLRTPVLGQVVGPPVRRSSWFADPKRIGNASLVWVTLFGAVILAASIIALLLERAA